MRPDSINHDELISGAMYINVLYSLFYRGRLLYDVSGTTVRTFLLPELLYCRDVECDGPHP
jgi:hypothetical protein